MEKTIVILDETNNNYLKNLCKQNKLNYFDNEKNLLDFLEKRRK